MGGHYYAAGPNLELLRELVEDEGLDAIVPIDFDMRGSDVHHRGLLLLHLCSKAVFEVTLPAGQLMELERCRDYDIKPPLIRSTMFYQDPQLSSRSLVTPLTLSIFQLHHDDMSL